MTLYLKYRPQTIEELDLESVRTALKSLLVKQEIPHAFLFSGSRGAGKTSAARILAKIVNCEKNDKKFGEPCNKCSSCLSIMKGSCLDVLELDAASHRGIDDIRALKDSVMLAPTSVRKKVYIIDEAHMLTTEAANAFLKTLEEPPDHAIFILATTNPEKLPVTIRSRTFNVLFQKANQTEIARQLNRVMKGESLKAEEGVIDLIAKASDGSFRDAVKMLEQLAFEETEITLEGARKMFSFSTSSNLDELLHFVSSYDAKSAIQVIETLAINGVSMKNYLDTLIDRLHEILLAKNGIPGKSDCLSLKIEDTVSLIDYLLAAKLQMMGSAISQLPIETALVKWIQAKGDKPAQSPVEREKKEQAQTKEQLKEKGTVGKVESKSTVDTSNPITELDGTVWGKILAGIKPKNASIEALLRAAFPIGFDGKDLRVGVYYRFHKERLDVITNKKTLEDVAAEVMGLPVRIICELTEKKADPAKEVAPALTPSRDPDIIEAAKEIFGA